MIFVIVSLSRHHSEKPDILIIIIASHPRTLVKVSFVSSSSFRQPRMSCIVLVSSFFSSSKFPASSFIISSSRLSQIPPQLLRHSSVTVSFRFSSAFFPEFTHGPSTSRAPMTRIIIFGSTPPVNPIVIHPKASVMACKQNKKRE